MPGQPNTPNVTVKRVSNGMCIVEPDPFVARRGTTVTFTFADREPDGVIVFADGAAPFAEDLGKGRFRFDRPHEVKEDLPLADPPTDSVRFDYTVEWRSGQIGGGTGDVPPGG